MKSLTLSQSLLLIIIVSFFTSCIPPVYKPMDIAAYSQKTKQWKFDYNSFPLNPNWQYKLVNGKAPWTYAQCPLSDDPAEWKSSRTCTSQSLHFNNGQIGCTNIFNRHGGHMNWFPVTEVGIVNFIDHSPSYADDDYNFYLQSPDSSLYLGSDGPPANQDLALEFDSDEFPDPVDHDYNIWWNHFHDAVDHAHGEAQAKIKNKLAIVTGMAGIDLGHNEANTWTSELHPVFSMFVLTDEQESTNADGTVAMTDTWSFFVRNIGDEGWCSSDAETAGKKQLKVFIPEMPYYYAGKVTPYYADARDNVTIDDGNVHITDWNGITDHNNPAWEHWTKQTINGGVILNFIFDNQSSDGIFVGDIIMKWNIHVSFKGSGTLQSANTFINELKFKNEFKGIYNSNRKVEREYETEDDSLLSIRFSKLNSQQQIELKEAFAGKIIIPNMPKLVLIPKGKSIKVPAVPARSDSVNTKQFNAQLRKMKIGDVSKNAKLPPVANPNQNEYIQRKQSKRAFIVAYLKSKDL